MVFETPPVQMHAVQILTPKFQITGELETIGPVDNYINDPRRGSFSIYEANVVPLTKGSPLSRFSKPRIILLASEILLLHFSDPESRTSIRPLVEKELLVAYTPVAVCRGFFHMSAEASVHEFLDVTQGDLLPITDVSIFPLTKLPDPFPQQAEMVLVGRDYLQFYHTAE